MNPLPSYLRYFAAARFCRLALLVTAVGCHQLSDPLDGKLADVIPGSAPTADQQRPAGSTKDQATRQEKIAAAQVIDERGTPEEAIDAYLQIVQHGRAPASVYHRLGVLYDQTGQFDRSARYYLAALQTESDNAKLLCDYGYSRYLQGDLAMAEQALRRATAADPKLARAQNNLGLVLARSDKQDEALAAFSLAGCSPSEAKSNFAYALISGDDRSVGRNKRSAVPASRSGLGAISSEF